MTETILFLLNTVLIFLETIMTGYLGVCFFQRRCSRPVYVLAVCALGIFGCVSVGIFEDIAFLKIAASFLQTAVWILLVLRTNVVQACFSSVLLMSYWTVMDGIFLMGASAWILGDPNAVYSSPYGYYLFALSAKTLELLGIVILGAFAKGRFRSREMVWTDWLRTLFFPTASLLISLVLAHMFYQSPELADELTLCACIILAADVLSVFLLDHLEAQQLAIRNNVILQRELKNERDSISTWIGAYREERKRSHEFQNQLSVLRGMADGDISKERLVNYLDSLLNVELPATRYIDTNRPIADVLLSQKAALAKDKGIAFRMQLDDLSIFPLPDDELVVVFSNLLDNAINACEKIPSEEERYISVKIRCQPKASYLYIENRTAEHIPIKNNRVVISHRDSIEHGFGLQNVTTILERRNALFVIDYREDSSAFSFSAQLMSDT